MKITRFCVQKLDIDPTYSWDEFLKLNGIAKYDENKEELKFNLGKYMENNKISEDKVITFRFVDE